MPARVGRKPPSMTTGSCWRCNVDGWTSPTAAMTQTRLTEMLIGRPPYGHTPHDGGREVVAGSAVAGQQLVGFAGGFSKQR